MLSVWNTDSFLDRAQELVKKAIDKHAKNTTTELDRSRLVKKGAPTRRRLGEQVGKHAHDGHKLRWKGKGCAADSRDTDWRGGGRHGGV